MSTPTKCDHEVFEKGTPILTADTGLQGGNVPFEEWVQKIAKLSGQRVDWHYSGGIAQVLFLGDRHAVANAIMIGMAECPARILHVFSPGEGGLYRRGVTEVPEGTLAAFSTDGSASTYIINDREGS